jgi:hypothetical protein
MTAGGWPEWLSLIDSAAGPLAVERVDRLLMMRVERVEQ